MYLSKLSKDEIDGKKFLVRVDLDVDSNADKNDVRLAAVAPTIKFLLENDAVHIFLAGHMGRFKQGEESKSTQTLLPILEEIISEKITFGREIKDGIKINLLENLRSTADEENNSQEFAKSLASLADIYINDAFAVSHREHSSIVSVPKLIPGFLGLHIEKEMEMLTKALENPNKPVITLISGIKQDKAQMIPKLKDFSDKVLAGGRLPEYIDPDYGQGTGMPELLKDPKVIVGRLIQDREDITIRTAELFEEEIKIAGTIILAGVMGKYEEEGHRQGTLRVFSAIANSSAFKIAGGGDTETALQMFNLKDKFDWISVGGGAMVEFLIHKTLPGIEVLKR